MDHDTPASFSSPANPQPPPLSHAPQPPPPARPEVPPPGRGPAPRRGKGTGAGWKIATILLAGFLVLSLLGNFLSALFSGFSAGSPGPMKTGPHFQELVLEDNDARDKFAVISLEGVISGQAFDPSGYNLVNFIEDQLELCAEDERVRAVLLKVDSPGGEVLASDEIYRLIERFQDATGKPVVASMGSLAASGGYYISAPCRWIVANELTITGSIGVIMSGYNWRGLMDKVGVEPMVFKSGDLKDMLSPSKRPEEVSAEEKALVQGMVNETFERFKTVVREGRAQAALRNGTDGQKLVEDWEEFADGRIISGKEAHRLGFVDELGNFETAVERALEITGLPAANLVAYRQPFRLGMLFRLLGESEGRAAQTQTVKLDLGFDLPRLEVGRLYFLPPHFAR
jgi:protease IV